MMYFKVICILIVVLLPSSSYSSSSSSSDLGSSSISSSLSSFISLISSNEGIKANFHIHPPFLRLLRLLSKDSADQYDSAELEPLLLSLNSLLSAAKEEIEGRNKGGNERIVMGTDDDGNAETEREKGETEETRRRERGHTGRYEDGSEGKQGDVREKLRNEEGNESNRKKTRIENGRNEGERELTVQRLNENKENADRRQLEEEMEEKEEEEKEERGNEEEEEETGDGEDSRLPQWIIDQIMEKVKEILEKLLVAVNSGLHHVVDGLHHVLGYYVPSNRTGDISEECAIDVADQNFLAHINKLWFLKMFDSWGKFQDGFFFGNLRAAGMYDECIKIQVTNEATVMGENVTRSYRGRYCSVTYTPKFTLEETGTGGRIKSPVVPSLRSGVSLATLGSPLPFSYGTCVPSTCTADDVQASLEAVLAEDGMEVAGVYCHAEEDEKDEFTSEDKAMVAIMAVFGILALVATVYDIVVESCDIKSFEVVRNFSLLQNLRKLFTYENPKETGDLITCLPMLRVTTMVWIIICHQYETNSGFVSNTFDSTVYQDPVIAQVVTNGWISVDTFFFITGLIIAFRLVPYMRADYNLFTHLRILASVIVRRIVRLAPVILCVSLFCASLLRFMASGPHAHILESFSQNTCREHWWKDPLFINNYLFPGNEGDDVNDCLSNCWYTAVDVQLLALLPVIFLPFVYHQILGLVVLCTLTIGSIVVPLAIIIAYDLPPTPLHHVLGEKRLEYMTHIFLVPWARAGPWVVGVWTGMLLRAPRIQRIRVNKILVFVGYVIAITLGLVLVLGLFPYNHVMLSLDGVVAKDWQENPAVCAIYGALAGPTWGLCLAWVVFTCHTGNAEIVNRVLSYPGWLPLARLCFTMYVVAPVIQLWWSTVQLQPTYYNYLSKLFESSGIFSMSLFFGILLFCIVELPVVQTFNLILPSPAKKHERAVLSISSSNKEGKDMTDGSRLFPMREV